MVEFLQLLFGRERKSELFCITMSLGQGTSGLGALQVRHDDVQTDVINLFERPKRETALVDGREFWVRPTGAISPEGPYRFQLPAHGAQSFLQPGATRLHLRFKIVNRDGTDITRWQDNDNPVAFVNLIASSFIKTVEVQINGSPITELRNDNCGLKAYMEHTTSYGVDARETHCAVSGFHLDEFGMYDEVDRVERELNAEERAHNAMVQSARTEVLTDAGNALLTRLSELHLKVPPAGKFRNKGFAIRHEMALMSRVVDVCGVFNADLFSVSKLVPPGVGLSVHLERASDDFLLMHGGDRGEYKIEIIDLKLQVRHVEVRDTITNQIRKTLSNGNGKENLFYELNKTIIRTFSFAAGLVDTSVRNAFSGRLPTTLVIAQMRTEALDGHPGRNPFRFDHYDKCHIAARINGRNYPSEPLTPDCDRRLDAIAYRHLFDNIGISANNEGNCCTLSQFRNGMNYFAIDLTPDRCGGGCSHDAIVGTLDVEIRYRNPLPHGTTLILFGIHRGEMDIDKDNNVRTNLPV